MTFGWWCFMGITVLAGCVAFTAFLGSVLRIKNALAEATTSPEQLEQPQKSGEGIAKSG